MWRVEWEGTALLELLRGMNYWDQGGGEYEISSFKYDAFEVLVVFIVERGQR